MKKYKVLSKLKSRCLKKPQVRVMLRPSPSTPGLKNPRSYRGKEHHRQYRRIMERLQGFAVLFSLDGDLLQYSAVVLYSGTQEIEPPSPPLSRPRDLVHIPIKMATHKLLDSGLALSMEVLELMHGRELLHIQSIGGHDIWE